MGRRSFLKTAIVASASELAFPSVLRSQGSEKSPNTRLNIACVGVGGKGQHTVQNLVGENLVAFCDVDDDSAAKIYSDYPKVPRFRDYRRMLDQLGNKIDAVAITTPDHMHYPIAVASMSLGKHVFLEKPLTHTIWESRQLGKLTAEKKLATQMGIQGHASEGLRLICEWIDDGAIGEVREVDAWCALSYYPWGHAPYSPIAYRRPRETPPIPSQLDWDLWLGVAAERPYHPAYHPGSWRAWWDFGNGMMGDRGAHTLDPVVTALQLGPPDSIEATSCGRNEDTHPVSAIVTFRFPARGTRPPVKLTWFEGTRCPRPPELEPGRRLGHPDGGALFKGSNGLLACGISGDNPRLIPESRMRDYRRPPRTLARVDGGHMAEWIRACKGEGTCGANFIYSALLTEICQLGNLAKRVDARIEWDGVAGKVTNLPEANEHVTKNYRPGFGV